MAQLIEYRPVGLAYCLPRFDPYDVQIEVGHRVVKENRRSS